MANNPIILSHQQVVQPLVDVPYPKTKLFIFRYCICSNMSRTYFEHWLKAPTRSIAQLARFGVCAQCLVVLQRPR